MHESLNPETCYPLRHGDRIVVTLGFKEICFGGFIRIECRLKVAGKSAKRIKLSNA
jgi:hypothetical protein